MKLVLSAAFIFASSFAATQAVADAPLRLTEHRESGQTLAKLYDRQSGVTVLIGCTQGTLGLKATYTKAPPISGNVEVRFHMKSGTLKATGVSLQQKNLVATQKSDANQADIGKALLGLSQLGANDQATMSIHLLGPQGAGEIGTFLISGAGSTKALRPILRECGL